MAFTEIKRPSRLKEEKRKPPAIGSITKTPNTFFVGLAKFGLLVLTAVIIYEMWKIITAAIQPAAESSGNFSIEPFIVIIVTTIGAVTLRTLINIKDEEQDMAKFENYKDAYEIEKADEYDDDDEEVDEGKYVRIKSQKIYSFTPSSTKFILRLSIDKENETETYWYFRDGLKARTLSNVVNDANDENTQIEIQTEETNEPRLEKWKDPDTDNILYVFIVPNDFELQHRIE